MTCCGQGNIEKFVARVPAGRVRMRREQQQNGDHLETLSGSFWVLSRGLSEVLTKVLFLLLENKSGENV